MMTTGGDVPVIILRENSSVTSGIEVQEKLTGAAIALANILRRTYGPRGLDKMLYKSTGETSVTNDGAKIISELLIKHPAAKSFVLLGQSQESVAGDGVTGCILFGAELMQEAGRLLTKGLHPLVLIEGYRRALDVALADLEENSIVITENDTTPFLKVAETAMNGKAAEGLGKHLATLVVEALSTVSRTEGDVHRCSSEDVLISKARHNSISESRLLRGLIIDKRIELQHMKRAMKDLKVATLTCPLIIEKTTRDAEIEITEVDQLSAFLDAETNAIEAKAQTLLDAGAQAIFTEGEIDKNLLHRLVGAGCFVASNLDRVEVERMAAISGATLVDILSDLNPDDLGYLANLRVERREGVEGFEERIFIEGCASPHFVTIEVGGSNDTSIEETVRAVHDALRATAEAMAERKISAGGGHPHASSAMATRIAAEAEAGRERLAMEAFARALEVIPSTLAANSGADALDRLLELRAAIRADQSSDTPSSDIPSISTPGITASGEVGDTCDCPSPTSSIAHAWQAATETATVLLRVDQVISARGD